MLKLQPMGQMQPMKLRHLACGVLHGSGNLVAGLQWHIILAPSLAAKPQTMSGGSKVGHAPFLTAKLGLGHDPRLARPFPLPSHG